jgi:hypothetical protein
MPWPWCSGCMDHLTQLAQLTLFTTRRGPPTPAAGQLALRAEAKSPGTIDTYTYGAEPGSARIRPAGRSSALSTAQIRYRGPTPPSEMRGLGSLFRSLRSGNRQEPQQERSLAIMDGHLACEDVSEEVNRRIKV